MHDNDEHVILRKLLHKTMRAPHTAKRAPVPGMGRLGSALPIPKSWAARCDRCERRGNKTEFIAASPYLVIKNMRDHFDIEHALECAFCFLKFAGFMELAEHVQEAHTAPEERQYKYATTSTNGEKWREFFPPTDERETTRSYGRGL